MDSVNKIFIEAKNNIVFQNELKAAGEKKYRPSIFWDKLDKTIYSAIYMGWLVARKEYSESNYKKSVN